MSPQNAVLLRREDCLLNFKRKCFTLRAAGREAFGVFLFSFCKEMRRGDVKECHSGRSYVCSLLGVAMTRTQSGGQASHLGLQWVEGPETCCAPVPGWGTLIYLGDGGQPGF